MITKMIYLFIYFLEKFLLFFLICNLFTQNYKGIFFIKKKKLGYGAVIFSWSKKNFQTIRFFFFFFYKKIIKKGT